MREPRGTIEGESDVLVVGAGPAGSAAGIVLARAGVRVCVVDQAQFPRDKTCGDAVSNDAFERLSGLGADVTATAVPHAVVRGARAVFPDGTSVGRTYQRPGYIIPRFHLDDALRRALQASGAELVQGCRVGALTREDGRIRGALGPSFRWSAKIVIAADGYGSLGLSALGEAKPRGRYLGVSTTAYYQGVAFPDGDDTAVHYFDRELPHGYGWVFPAVDGTANVGVYLRADGYERARCGLRQLFSDFLARHPERFRHASRQGKPRTWSLPLAPRPIAITAPGLLLAGDAGGFIDPLTGEGIWQALHTGMLAGEASARSLSASGELGDAERRRYERACGRAIGRPSRGKAWVQEALTVLVDHRLYRLPAVRAALSWGYRHNALEMTKS